MNDTFPLLRCPLICLVVGGTPPRALELVIIRLSGVRRTLADNTPSVSHTYVADDWVLLIGQWSRKNRLHPASSKCIDQVHTTRRLHY